MFVGSSFLVALTRRSTNLLRIVLSNTIFTLRTTTITVCNCWTDFLRYVLSVYNSIFRYFYLRSPTKVRHCWTYSLPYVLPTYYSIVGNIFFILRASSILRYYWTFFYVTYYQFITKFLIFFALRSPTKVRHC